MRSDAPCTDSGLAIPGGGCDAAAAGELGEGAPQVSLFSGLVGNDAMQAAFKKVSAGGAALRFGGAPRAERVVMAGPGGRGRVEVAVSEPQQPSEVRICWCVEGEGVVCAEMKHAVLQGGDDGAGRPGGRAGAAVVGAARAVAKGLLRGGEPLSLQCCVMSVCLVRASGCFDACACMGRAELLSRSRGTRWPGTCCLSRPRRSVDDCDLDGWA